MVRDETNPHKLWTIIIGKKIAAGKHNVTPTKMLIFNPFFHNRPMEINNLFKYHNKNIEPDYLTSYNLFLHLINVIDCGKISVSSNKFITFS